MHLGYRRIYDGPNHVDTKIVIRPSRVPIFLTTACCIVLLGFEVYTALRISPTHSWIHSGLCATYVRYALFVSLWYLHDVQAYASLLGVLAFSFTWFSVAQSSVDVTLLSAWAVYAYRDVWPLLTYHLKPLDVAEGPVIWVKISILTLAAIAIPAFRPRHYVPYNPAVRNITHFVSTPIDHYNRNLRKNLTQSRRPAFSPARSSLTWTLSCWQQLVPHILVLISFRLSQILTT